MLFYLSFFCLFVHSALDSFPTPEKIQKIIKENSNEKIQAIDFSTQEAIHYYTIQAKKLISESNDQLAGATFLNIFPQFYSLLPEEDKKYILKHYSDKMLENPDSDKLSQMRYFIEVGGPYTRKLMEQVPSLVLDKEWGSLISESSNKAITYSSEEIKNHLYKLAVNNNMEILDKKISLGEGNISSVYLMEFLLDKNKNRGIFPQQTVLKFIRPGSLKLGLEEAKVFESLVEKKNMSYYKIFDKSVKKEFNLFEEIENIKLGIKYYNELSKKIWPEHKRKVYSMKIDHNFIPNGQFLALSLVKGNNFHTWHKLFSKLNVLSEKKNLCLISGMGIKELLKVWTTIAFKYGFFHSDLHGKNVFLNIKPELDYIDEEEDADLFSLPWNVSLVDFGKAILVNNKEKELLKKSWDLIIKNFKKNKSLNIDIENELKNNNISSSNISQFWHSFKLLEKIVINIESDWNSTFPDKPYPYSMKRLIFDY